MEKCALITGATSGIGEATARVFAENGYDVIITGRRSERLKILKSDLENEYGTKVKILCFDVRDESSCIAAVGSLSGKFAEIGVLVNNAGLAAGLEHIDQGDPNDWNTMIDTNIKGLLNMTRAVTNLMIARGRGGHVVNLGSIAGTQVYENGNVYCATKHAVHALSQGIRIDLLAHGIHVTEIRPGMVDTEFSTVRFHGDNQRADEVYRGIEPLTGNDIAEAIFWAVSQPEHVNIDEIVLTPRAQANSYYTCRKGK